MAFALDFVVSKRRMEASGSGAVLHGGVAAGPGRPSRSPSVERSSSRASVDPNDLSVWRSPTPMGGDTRSPSYASSGSDQVHAAT
jgi:hypothetical protein